MIDVILGEIGIVHINPVTIVTRTIEEVLIAVITIVVIMTTVEIVVVMNVMKKKGNLMIEGITIEENNMMIVETEEIMTIVIAVDMMIAETTADEITKSLQEDQNHEMIHIKLK
jgi:hypothetical protein